MRCIIYTDSLSSMLAIENNRENHPILNQIYDILAELQNQGKQITICKVPAHIGVKENKEADRAEKQGINIPGMTAMRLPYSDYYQTIRGARNSHWQTEWENSISKQHYIKSRIEGWESAHKSNRQYEVILSRIRIEHTRLNMGI